MRLDKRKYNLYLTAAVIGGALLFMAVSLWKISADVGSSTSADLAIDRMVDRCWEEKGLDP